jgi:hypothetical protein
MNAAPNTQYAHHPSGLLILFIFVGIVVAVILLIVWFTRWGDRQREIGRQHDLRRAARETTPGEVHTQKAMRGAVEDVLGNMQQNRPPPSLSTRLAQLDAALQAGHINQQEHAKKRADIIGSA